MNAKHWPQRATLAAIAAALAACAPLQLQTHDQAWRGLAQREFSAPPAIDLGTMLQHELDADAAVRITLANSPALHALLAQARAESAALTQAQSLPNPVFALERMVVQGHSPTEKELSRSLSLNLGAIALWPWRAQAAAQAQTLVRLQGLQALAQVAIEARSLWVAAVAAQQVLAYQAQVLESAGASTELARRMREAGNFTKLQAAREKVYLLEATAQHEQAQRLVASTREAMLRRLGLAGTHAAMLKLPARLPVLPALLERVQAASTHSASADALQARLDVQLAQARLQQAGGTQAMARWQPWLQGLHASLLRSYESGNHRQRGAELELVVPLLDTGSAGRAQASQATRAAALQAQQVVLEAASRWREREGERTAALRAAWHQRREVLPVRKTIADETLLRYNAMLIGPFELMAESRLQVLAVVQALQAEAAFWQADAALHAERLGVPARLEPAADAAGSRPATPAGDGH